VIHDLARIHVSTFGTPKLASVDGEIFRRRYFTRCMECGFCEDACCSHGVDVDEPTVRRILRHAGALETATSVPRDDWFEPGFAPDGEHPGGKYTRTRVRDGYCVFKVRGGRGCALHAHALSEGIDYHLLKPMVSALFPLTFDEGLLHASTEALDGTLVCGGSGPTLYRGARDELEHYFGHELVRELDALEPQPPTRSSSAR
jgi:hypothetical protein